MGGSRSQSGCHGSGSHAESRAALTLDVLAAHTRLEHTTRFEQHRRWEVAGYRGQEIHTALRSGMHLSASSCRWGEEAGAIVVDHVPSDLSFIVSRGAGMHANIPVGSPRLVGGGTFQMCQVNRSARVRYEAQPDAHDEAVCLDVGSARLRELLGTEQLPAALQRLLSHESAYPIESQPMTPKLFRLLDEILYCDASSATRQLYLEAKGLELLAALVDQLEEVNRDTAPRLSAADIERLQLARSVLLARLEAPPSLPELARRAGLNEAKLKSGFRLLFGSSVFGYLRQQRMEEARRLLRAQRHAVTEVAARVGYANPSKFAAAFRKAFGVSPSTIT